MIEDNIKIIYKVIKDRGLMERVEEYVDIGYIGITKARNSYEEGKGAKFSTYAYTVIENEIKREIEKEIKRKSTEEISINDRREGMLENIEIIDSGYNLEREVMKKIEIEDMRRGIMMLEEEERKIIEEGYGIGCEERNRYEIAKEIGISMTTYRKKEQRALKKIKEEMMYKEMRKRCRL